MKHHFLFAAVLIIASCKSQKPAADLQPADRPVQAGNNLSLATTTPAAETMVLEDQEHGNLKEFKYRFIVSFISKGEGTDAEAARQFHRYIKEYATTNGKRVFYQPVPWGREGESDFCFPLSDMKTDAQKQFIKDIKDRLRDSKLVQYYENQTCPHMQ